jgi:hypothetical protein
MPKYHIGRAYGYAGTEETDVIEADSLDEAQEIASEWAMERVDSWAELVDESTYERDHE